MDVNNLILEAVEAANNAGDLWMQNAKVQFAVLDGDTVVGALLDVCGNSYIRFTDRRTKAYKVFDKHGAVSNGTIHVPHKYVYRQEYGLQRACASAALQVFRSHGIEKLNLWSYID